MDNILQKEREILTTTPLTKNWDSEYILETQNIKHNK